MISPQQMIEEISHNAANHRHQEAERGTSGVFWYPSAFALLFIKFDDTE
jgi:hypothetical protein